MRRTLTGWRSNFCRSTTGSPDGGSMGEIETADDYLELAEQAASKKAPELLEKGAGA